ncbi:hypothetical protein PQX77_016905 [Marasmius sp. AFHP31]|nr:hypothetical protein PQX77_016905 [Marasmius sp. AFHP31]
MILDQSSSFDEASVPSDLTIPQFLLDQYEHPTRPKRPIDVPCLIDEDTGARLYMKDLRDRTRHLAGAINKIWNLNEGDIGEDVLLCSATNGLHHLNISRPSLLFTHPDCVNVAAQAAEMIRLPSERIILITGSGSGSTTTPLAFRTFEELVRLGRAPDCPPVIEKRLQPGEAKRRIAFLAPSSGTTGLQKAVAISHYNAISVIVQIATFNRIGEDYAPWAERRFRPGDHPAVKKYNLKSVRYCIVAAAPLSATLTSGLLELFPNAHLGQGYGMTETCGTVSMFPLSQKVGTLGSGGQFLPGTAAKVVKPDGSIADIGEVGELFVKGGQVALGYYGNEKATRETFVDGWLRTGDQVYFDEHGDIFIVERIKVKGLQVAPAELEGHLLTHASIADAAVIGVPDEYAGELPFAFVVLQPHVASMVEGNAKMAEEVRSSIFKYVADAKSRYKWLTGGIQFTDSIPRNASGKILRRLLREEREKEVPDSSYARTASSNVSMTGGLIQASARSKL